MQRKKNLSKKKKHTQKDVGLPPGSLVYTGHHTDVPVHIEHISYTNSAFNKQSLSVEQLNKEKMEAQGVNWIAITGLHDVRTVNAIGEQFGLHPLYLEDLLNVNQRPKAEVGDHSIFVTLKSFSAVGLELEQNQISFFVTGNTLISFVERPTSLLDPIFKRMQNEGSRLRNRSVDYLLYALVDIVVDGYYVVVRSIDENQEAIEDRIAEDEIENVLEEIRGSKKQLLQLRRAIQPLQEAIVEIVHGESRVFEEKTLVFIKDIQDHVKQIIEMVEFQIDNNRGLSDGYTNYLSNRMNEIMKVLTVISTIFIPLSFIAGLYGMNFVNMPELQWHNGYYFALSIMVLVVGGMLFYFKKQKWF